MPTIITRRISTSRTVEGDALMRLSTLQVMAGRIRAKDFRIAIEWAGAHVEVGTWDGPGYTLGDRRNGGS